MSKMPENAMFKHSNPPSSSGNLAPFSPRSPESTPPHKKSALIWALIVLGLFGVFLFVRLVMQTRAGSTGTTLTPKSGSIFQTVKNFFFHQDAVLIGQAEDRINILLLGVGGPGHDGPYLSDTNIIVSIKPSTGEVALISVPRDLGAKVGEHGWRKINSADAFGEAENPGAGGDYARKIFEQTFDMSIPYYVRVDFTAFSELVDAVGGITVNVPRSFVDTAFPGPNFSYTTISFDAGLQTMHGEQALNYARSRHGNNEEGSDFARARRQQLIIDAFKAKVLSLGTYSNPVTIQNMYSSMANHIATNLNLGELAYLGSMAGGLHLAKNVVLDSSPDGFLVNTTGDNGAFILWPKTGNFDTINATLKTIFESTSTQALAVAAAQPNTTQTIGGITTFAPVKIEVQNGTWIPGLAARIQKRWQESGLTIISVGNSLKRPMMKTAVFVLKQKVDQKVLDYVTKDLRATSTAILPNWLQENYDNASTTESEVGMKYNKDSDILVILGTDTQK